MIDEKKLRYPQDEARPLLVTIICLFGFIYVSIFLLMMLFLPEMTHEIVRVFGRQFLLFTFINNLVILISIFGLWRMKRWGFLLFTFAYIIGAFYGFIINVEFLLGYIPGFLIIFICAFYVKKMS